LILNGILLIFQGLLELLFAPISLFNITIDFVSSIPVVASFLQISAYLLPWSNIMPVVLLTIAMFLFRIAIAIYFFFKNAIQWW